MAGEDKLIREEVKNPVHGFLDVPLLQVLSTPGHLEICILSPQRSAMRDRIQYTLWVQPPL